jgi:hypothetical protein
MLVEDLRADVDVTPELKRLRDRVGASADGVVKAPARMS